MCIDQHGQQANVSLELVDRINGNSACNHVWYIYMFIHQKVLWGTYMFRQLLHLPKKLLKQM